MRTVVLFKVKLFMVESKSLMSPVSTDNGHDSWRTAYQPNKIRYSRIANFCLEIQKIFQGVPNSPILMAASSNQNVAVGGFTTNLRSRSSRMVAGFISVSKLARWKWYYFLPDIKMYFSINLTLVGTRLRVSGD